MITCHKSKEKELNEQDLELMKQKKIPRKRMENKTVKEGKVTSG